MKNEIFQSYGFAQFQAGGLEVKVIKRDITTVVAPGAKFGGADKKKGVKVSNMHPHVVRLVKPGATVELFSAGQSVAKISH